MFAPRALSFINIFELFMVKNVKYSIVYYYSTLCENTAKKIFFSSFFSDFDQNSG